MRRYVIISKGVAYAVWRRSIYTAGVLMSVFFIIQLYYALPTGSWFLTSKDVQVNTALAGRDVPFDWCRSPRHGAIEAKATRTFYKRMDDGRFTQVSDYPLTPTIEPIDPGCAPLSIKASVHPQDEGTYFFVTDLTWSEHGYEKKLQYRSNQYVLLASAASLQQRIDELEEEVAALKAQRDSLLGLPTPTPQPVAPQPSSSPAPAEPETSVTQQPSTGAGSGSGNNGASQGLLGPVVDVLNGVVEVVPLIGGNR